MIVDPLPSRLIRSISQELQTTLADAFTEPALKSLASMMSAVLETVAIRVDHESGWMIEETQQIEQAVSELAASLPDHIGLRTALVVYRSGSPRPPGHPGDRATYLQAGALLSTALSATQDDPDHFARLESLVEARVQREAVVVGGIALVGRF